MSQLEFYFNEHAAHARQHEDHREHITTAVLTLAGIMITLVTFAGLTWNALPAAASVVLLGIFGYMAAGKHYERFRLHTAVLEKIRDEIDRVNLTPGSVSASLRSLRLAGENEHYQNFSWPFAPNTTSVRQANAKAWIARRRTRLFWEVLHLGVALIGIALCSAIVIKSGPHDSVIVSPVHTVKAPPIKP
jgi:hypothetical protein